MQDRKLENHPDGSRGSSMRPLRKPEQSEPSLAVVARLRGEFITTPNSSLIELSDNSILSCLGCFGPHGRQKFYPVGENALVDRAIRQFAR
jgi:hypothetical protein